MITPQHREESLSRAYLQAVVGHAGHILRFSNNLDYGVDASMHQVKSQSGHHFETGFALDLQLKATINWSEDHEGVVYDLEADTYNYLLQRFSTQRAAPIILAVLCLPREPDEWLRVSENQLIMKRCCYWTRLKGSPTNNKYTVRIKIPKQQALTPNTVNELLLKVASGEIQ